MWFYHKVMPPKGIGRVSNSKEADQTASREAV